MSKVTMEEAEEVAWTIIALDEYREEWGAKGLFHILTGIQNGLSVKRAISYMKSELKKWCETKKSK